VIAMLVFCAGFLRAVGPSNGVGAGVACSLLSALAWTGSTVAMNTVLNFLAALFAAASAGFMAPPTTVCAWHHLPLLCP